MSALSLWEHHHDELDERLIKQRLLQFGMEELVVGFALGRLCLGSLFFQRRVGSV